MLIPNGLDFYKGSEMEENTWNAWTRNVISEFKSLSEDEIKQKIAEVALPFSVMMSNIQGDFNLSCIVRSANAIGAKKVYYYGKKRYDKRGCVGTYKYTEVEFLPDYDCILRLKQEYKLVALENNISRKCQALKNYTWSKNSLIIIGEESVGISDEILDICDDYVYIQQRGSVRSMNAAVAGSIAMNSFADQWS